MPQSNKASPISVSIIGAGRLGSALALALETAGYRVEAVVAQRLDKARRTSKMLGGTPLFLSARQLNRLPDSEVTIISTPDDQIAKVAEDLAELNRHSPNRRVYLHTSGALSSQALAPLSKKAAAVGSLHPLIAVTQMQKGSQSLRGAFWCVEGDTTAAKVARRIVEDLDGQSFSIKAHNKPLYHAAAVMVSGHVVALFDLALGMLIKSGLSGKRAREILLPLIQSNARNLVEREPAQALTGSFARGDTATIKRHLRALTASNEKDALAVYRILGKRSLELAAANKLNKRALKEIRKLLAEED